MEIKDPPSKVYYDYLKGKGLDVPPTYESFTSTLKDKKSAEQYYGYLREQKRNQPDLDLPPTPESFYTTLAEDGAKKKYRRLISRISRAARAFLFVRCRAACEEWRIQ